MHVDYKNQQSEVQVLLSIPDHESEILEEDGSADLGLGI
jgi:hypothetical protein